MELYKKLFAIQGKNITITKSANNPFFKSKYVLLEEIQQALNPVLQEEKLLVYHKLVERTFGDMSPRSFLVTHVTWIEAEGVLESEFPIPQGLDAQKIGAAMTYGKRQNLTALFNLTLVGEDDDGNSVVEAPKEPAGASYGIASGKMANKKYTPPKNLPTNDEL